VCLGKQLTLLLVQTPLKSAKDLDCFLAFLKVPYVPTKDHELLVTNLLLLSKLLVEVAALSEVFVNVAGDNFFLFFLSLRSVSIPLHLLEESSGEPVGGLLVWSSKPSILNMIHFNCFQHNKTSISLIYCNCWEWCGEPYAI